MLIEKIKLIPEFLFLVFKYVKLSSIPNVFISKLLHQPIKIKFKDGTETNFIYLGGLKIWKYKKEIVDREKEIFCWEIDNKKYYGTMVHAFMLYKIASKEIEGEYPADFKEKRVLDVGGHNGDTAMYFLDRGAQFVDIYEPVELNIEIMKMNLQQYPAKRYRINKLAVGDREGEIKIKTTEIEGSGKFGLKLSNFLNKLFKIESKEYKFSCISFTKILKENNYDVAKIDCEGCEEFLVRVEDELIRKVPVWLIETHSKEIEKKILEKFQKNKFKITLIKRFADRFRVYKFELEKN
ncbi:MAG: FkbM family methyltransferase [Candidatus Anstonellaceae archaeon]